jgi:hypothetical protein
MRNSIPIYFKILLPVCMAILVASSCQGQNDASRTTESEASWKTLQLAELDRQLAVETVKGTSRSELEAQKAWLSNWTEGGMTSKSNTTSQLPKLRTEPILNSDLGTEYRKRLNWDNTEQDETDLLVLKQALADHPGDIGLQQLHLQWMDLPIRRKTLLKQIDGSAVGLIKSLKAQNQSDLEIRLATEFALYRRGRALAYRELPDVVKQTPIDDPEQLNQEITSVYQDLIDSAGEGRPEFILLEIRILRRSKSFGNALCLLEKYGSVIKPQWYLKKRRDLLKELGWEIPYAEAAEIYANEFPQEVAKEAAQQAQPTGS